MLSAMVVDDHPVTRSCDKLTQERYEVVAETSKCATTIRFSRKYLTHLILLVLSIPDIDRLTRIALPQILAEVLELMTPLSLVLSSLFCMNAGPSVLSRKQISSAREKGHQRSQADFTGNVVCENNTKLSELSLKLISADLECQYCKVILLNKEAIKKYWDRMAKNIHVSRSIYIVRYTKQNGVI